MTGYKGKLNKILKNNFSGSDVIQKRINLLIKDNINDKEALKEIFEKSEASLKDFSGIVNYFKKIKKLRDKNQILQFVDEFEKYFNNQEFFFQNAAIQLKKHKKIFTLSYSSTVLQILLELKKINKGIEIVVAESRPVLEGRRFAKLLLKNNIKTNFVTDAAAASIISQCDCILLGADSILESGDIINKTGSYSAALIANKLKIPVYVYASKSKITKSSKLNSKKQNPDEIWSFEHPLLKITNNYFEKVPKNLITRLITF